MTADIAPMQAEQTGIEGLWKISTKSVTDERGTVREYFRTSAFTECRMPLPGQWQQINMTWTHRGGVRGLHGEAVTKLVGVAYGAAFGAYLDAREGSPTRGAVITVELSMGVQMLVPPGVCNGFQAVSEPGCQYVYCFDAEWTSGMPGVAVTPLDPDLGIAWPIPVDAADARQISAKDSAALRLAEL